MNGEERVSPAELQQYLSGVDYPAGKNELRQHAEQQGADEKILNFLDNLPDQEYNSPADVSQSVGEVE